MTRQWIAGFAALAMMTGVAAAQTSESSSSSTRSTTVNNVPVQSEVSGASKVEHTDSDGNHSEKVESFRSGVSGSSSSSSFKKKTVGPDGVQERSVQEEHTVAPAPAVTTSTTKKSSTTVHTDD